MNNTKCIAPSNQTTNNLRPAPGAPTLRERLREVDSARRGWVPEEILARFAVSPEVARLRVRSARATHIIENFLRTVSRLDVMLEHLEPEFVWDLVVLAFAHDYIRGDRRRAGGLDTTQVTRCLVAFFRFLGRVGLANADACQRRLEDPSAQVAFAASVASSLGRA